MNDSETKCEYCEKIHPDWFACSKYVDLIVRSAPINAAPPETECKCQHLENGEVVTLDKDNRCKCGRTTDEFRLASPETKCKCGCEGNNRGWSTEKVWDKKCIYHKDNLKL